MIIEDVGLVRVAAGHRGDWLFLQVHTEDGHVGIGEASQSGNDDLTAYCIHNQIRPLIRGKDGGQIHAILHDIWRSAGHRLGSSLPVMTALSATEQALWDLRGQSLGVPVHALWGGVVRDRVRLYANVNRSLQARTPEAFAGAACSAVREGFTAVKISPFDGVGPRAADLASVRRAYAAGLDRIAAVREAIGEGIDLMVDCQGCFSLAQSLEVARDVERFRLFWLEEPFKTIAHAECFRALRAVTSLAFAAGEFEAELARFKALLEAGAQYVMMDVKHCGGLWQALRIAAVAEAHGGMISPHNPSGPVSQAASLHVCAVAPNVQFLEFPWGEVSWRHDLVRPAERVEDGHLRVPTAPGLGISLDPDTVKAHVVVGLPLGGK